MTESLVDLSPKVLIQKGFVSWNFIFYLSQNLHTPESKELNLAWLEGKVFQYIYKALEKS